MEGYKYVVQLKVVQAKDLSIVQGPYINAAAEISVNKQQKQQSKVIKYSQTCPVWNESFQVYLQSLEDILLIRVVDSDKYLGDALLGECDVDLSNDQSEWIKLRFKQQESSGQVFVEHQTRKLEPGEEIQAPQPQIISPPPSKDKGKKKKEKPQKTELKPDKSQKTETKPEKVVVKKDKQVTEESVLEHVREVERIRIERELEQEELRYQQEEMERKKIVDEEELKKHKDENEMTRKMAEELEKNRKELEEKMEKARIEQQAKQREDEEEASKKKLRKEMKYSSLRGFLNKRGHVRRNWKTRFFVIRGNELWYYSSNTMQQTKGRMRLPQSKIKTEPDAAKDRKFCFSITTEDGKDLIIAATDEKERDMWMEALTFIATNPSFSARASEFTEPV